MKTKWLVIAVFAASVLCACSMFSPDPAPVVSFQYGGGDVKSGDIYDFGDVAVGTVKALTFTVANTNQGTADLVITCHATPPFAAEGFSGTIAPGKTVNAIVTFTPSSAKVFVGQFVLETNREYYDRRIVFTGTGVVP